MKKNTQDTHRYTYYECHNGTHVYKIKTIIKHETYPKALRFKTAEECIKLARARKQFIQSTKIPVNCKACPLCETTIECKGYRGTIMCRITWRKIWEYVK